MNSRREKKWRRGAWRWPRRRIDPWISIVDPDGLVHCIGNITPSHDYTECGLEIVRGWYAIERRKPRGHVCSQCWRIARRHRLSPVGLTAARSSSGPIMVTGTDASTITIHGNTFSPREFGDGGSHP